MLHSNKPATRGMFAIYCLLILLTGHMSGCFIGMPHSIREVAGAIINSSQVAEVVVVLHNTTGQRASWTVVWESENDVHQKREVTTAAEEITPIVVNGNVQSITLGSFDKRYRHEAVELAGSKTIKVPYSGPAYVVGEHLFQGDVLRFTLKQTENGPTIIAEVIPGG